MTVREAPARVLFHVQHLLGVGHQVRAGAIARAMSDAGLEVHVAQGGASGAADAQDPSVHVHRLPAARSADAQFSGLVTETGQPVDDAWRAARRDRLMQVFDTVAPDILLIEGYPFARRQFRFELDPLLNVARGRIPVAVSIRDILVEKNKPGRADEIVAVVQDGIDRVLVHGDPVFVRLQQSFPMADRIAGKTVYTGYVVADPPGRTNDGDDGRDEIVVSAGGGAVGGSLLRGALAAAQRPAMEAYRWRLLLGPNLPDDDRSALAALPDNVVAEPVRHDFRAILARAAASVSQAGYNTMMDLSVAGCRSVLVPFASAGETEQPLRAELARQRGWAAVVPEAGLTPDRLADTLRESLAGPRPGPWPLDRGGAVRTAALVKQVAMDRRCDDGTGTP